MQIRARELIRPQNLANKIVNSEKQQQKICA